MKHKDLSKCPRCGNLDIKFDYYFKEYYCPKCGWRE